MREIDVLAVVDRTLQYVKPAVVLRPQEDAAVFRALSQLEKLNLPEEIRKQALSVLRAVAEKEGLDLKDEDCAALLEVEAAASDEPVLLEVNSENYPVLYTVMELVEERLRSDLLELAAYAWALQGGENQEESGVKEAEEQPKEELSVGEAEDASLPLEEIIGILSEFKDQFATFKEQLVSRLEKLEAEVSSLKSEAVESERESLLKRVARAVAQSGVMDEASAFEQLKGLSDDLLKVVADIVLPKENSNVESILEKLIGAQKPTQESFEAPESSEALLESIKVDDPRVPNPNEVSGPAGSPTVSVEEAALELESQITEEDDETFYAVWRINR
jgi:hypothetical protein